MSRLIFPNNMFVLERNLVWDHFIVNVSLIHVCTHVLLPDVDGIMPLQIRFILRLNNIVRQSQDRTATDLRPWLSRPLRQSVLWATVDTPRAVSSFVIMSTCESAYLHQGDTNIVLPTDYREKAILHIAVQADVLVGVIGLYVGQLLDREVLTRKSVGNCT
jgi:hypothetical protein